MKKLSMEQMVRINGGINWCAVSVGVTGVGGALMLAGLALAGPFAIAAYASFALYATACELMEM